MNPNAQRYLIVNADDFGLCEGVNRGIIAAAKHGIVTSASLMVRQPAAETAAAWARRHPELSLGLHLDLAEWIYRDGAWLKLYEVVPADDEIAVRREVTRQLAVFRALAGRDPTHLDSHQHAHRREPVRSIVLEAASRLGIPVRDCTPGIRYCGDFYGQTAEGETLPDALTVQGLERILTDLTSGVTELGCHPGYCQELQSVYRLEREAEVNVLCAPQTRHVLTALGIKLCSFSTLPRPLGSTSAVPVAA